MPCATASKIFFSLIVITALASTPRVVFAQHGGGGHGGGGGFHGGGAGGFRGGGSSGRGRSFGGSTGRSFGVAPSAPRLRGGFSPQRGENSLRSSPGNAAPVRNTGERSTVAAPSDGQWHSFGRFGAGRGPVASVPQARNSAGTGWQAFGGARSSAGTHTTRSFSGQGSQIWETTPMVRDAGASRPPSSVRGNLHGDGALRNSPRLGAPFMSWRGFGFRERRDCWNCGFRWGFGLGWWPGWGFSWGLGWPWLGDWNWGPAWIDPVWGWPGYDYNSYPAEFGPDDPYDDSFYSAPAENDQDSYADAPLID